MDDHELITGDTYRHRDAIRALGGLWDAAKKGWWVPVAKAPEARTLVGAVPAAPARRGGGLRPDGPHGLCTACGDDCGGTAWSCGYA